MRISLNNSNSRKRCAEDKENLSSANGHFRGLGKLLCRPNEQYVCMELPLESFSNKKSRPSPGVLAAAAAAVPAYARDESVGRCQAPKKSRHPGYNYLKPGMLAHLRDAQNKRKRAEYVSDHRQHHHPNLDTASNAVAAPGLITGSPERVPAGAGITPRCFGPACLQRKKLLAPKFTALHPVPAPVPVRQLSPALMVEDMVVDVHEPTSSSSGSSTTFDMLPLELLVRIVCRLDHNELKPVFHVSKSLRQAVMIAQQCHFNFTTPGRDHKTVSDAASHKPDQSVSFLSDFAAGISSARLLPTPNAPKHAVKAPKSRISEAELRQITATLFPGTQLPVMSHNARPPTGRGGVSHRVLFNEEELCKAIAQNTL